MIDESDKLTINIIANAALGPGMSGGDKIFIECARRWAKLDHTVNIFVWEEGYEMCKRNNLENVNYIIWHVSRYKKLGFIPMYLIRTIKGCIGALKVHDEFNNNITFSASDFWPDVLPAFMMKKRFRNSKWVAALYFFAPTPFKGPLDIDYRGGSTPFSLKNLVYSISQRIVYRLMKRNADFIIVANELDKKFFVNDGVSSAKVKPVYGGVDLKNISLISQQAPKYDGCFVGRLHPQKGPLELVEIWDLVYKKRENAKLALIGNGPLEKKVKNEIRKRGLEKNIDMLGYVDREQKYKILKSSRVFLHSPVADTGGMAAAEAMACGLPVVGFDLPGYTYCYPLGMLKVPIGDVEAFANLILSLLEDKDLYDKVKKEAIEYVQEWDWENRAESILDAMKNLWGKDT